MPQCWLSGARMAGSPVLTWNWSPTARTPGQRVRQLSWFKANSLPLKVPSTGLGLRTQRHGRCPPEVQGAPPPLTQEDRQGTGDRHSSAGLNDGAGVGWGEAELNLGAELQCSPLQGGDSASCEGLETLLGTVGERGLSHCAWESTLCQMAGMSTMSPSEWEGLRTLWGPSAQR